MEIIICDDDKFMLEFSKKLADECIDKYGFNVKIVCVTTDFQEILNFISKNPGNYLYFLDLDFGKERLNGVDIARQIKKIFPLSKIVFVTSYGDMGIQILKSGIEPFGFIEKSLNTNEMLSSYRKYISMALELKDNYIDKKEKQKNNTNEKSIDLPIGIDEVTTILISQILYVETLKNKSHFISYHTIDGSVISARDTIENVLNTLGDDFMKSHRSIIINKKYVVGVEDGFVKFADGQTVPCAFRLKNNIIRNCLD